MGLEHFVRTKNVTSMYLVYRLNRLHLRNLCNTCITIHLPTPEGLTHSEQFAQKAVTPQGRESLAAKDRHPLSFATKAATEVQIKSNSFTMHIMSLAL